MERHELKKNDGGYWGRKHWVDILTKWLPFVTSRTIFHSGNIQVSIHWKAFQMLSPTVRTGLKSKRSSAPWALFTSSVPSIAPLFYLGFYSSGHFLVFSNTPLYFLKIFPSPFSTSFRLQNMTWTPVWVFDSRFCCHGNLHYSIIALLILLSSFVFYFASALKW